MIEVFFNGDATLIDEQEERNVASSVGLAEFYAANLSEFFPDRRDEIVLHLIVAVNFLLFHMIADSCFIQIYQTGNRLVGVVLLGSGQKSEHLSAILEVTFLDGCFCSLRGLFSTPAENSFPRRYTVALLQTVLKIRIISDSVRPSLIWDTIRLRSSSEIMLQFSKEM